MALSKEITQIIIVTTVCLILIALRITYRLARHCKVHAKCHRKPHIDDLWMGFSVLPLLARALCICWSYSASLTELDESASFKTREEAGILKYKLLIPGRIFYMFFLWCMKMCLLEFYLRLCDGLPFYRRIGTGIRWSLYATFVAVVLATLLECRPLPLAWNRDPAGAQCRKARVNLITMAVCNIVTDLALILFPISFLRRSGLDFSRFLRLSLLFALGSLIIITTIIRLPLILSSSAQKTRSLWASIEIACACFIANAAVFKAMMIDIKAGKASHANATVNEYAVEEQREQVQRMRTKSIARKGEEDEMELWHIEKMVSLHVGGDIGEEGRKNSNFVFEQRKGGLR